MISPPAIRGGNINILDYPEWYNININAIIRAGYFFPEDLELIMQSNPVLVIREFPLPPNFRQKSSNLMIVFPYKNNIFNTKPDRFYLDKGLKLKNGSKPEHIYNNGLFNDLKKRGWARFSFHLKKWSPSLDIVSGDTIYDILEAITKGLSVL